MKDSLVEIHILTINTGQDSDEREPKQWLAENQKNELKDATNSVELRTTARLVIILYGFMQTVLKAMWSIVGTKIEITAALTS